VKQRKQKEQEKETPKLSLLAEVEEGRGEFPNTGESEFEGFRALLPLLMLTSKQRQPGALVSVDRIEGSREKGKQDEENEKTTTTLRCLPL
jgi:hypothetical protein